MPQPPTSEPDDAERDYAGPPTLDITVPHAARIHNYFIGGKDNYPIDREPAEEIMKLFPGAITTAIQNRAFLSRAVRFLAGEAGVRQFLDIGTGIPLDRNHFGGQENIHQVAQGIAAESRVVYVDNDPLVLLHARALMPSAPEGIVSVIDGDLRDPNSILKRAELTEVLDLDRPVALSLGSILHFFPDQSDEAGEDAVNPITSPADLVAQLVEWLAPGSYLVISHGASDFAEGCGDLAKNMAMIYRSIGIPLQLRTRAQVKALVPRGMKIVNPGTVLLHHWRPDGTCAVPEEREREVAGYGLIARKA